ncbi:GrdX family protein [Tissierella sp. MB52-C2]|uniref:GrdX family protein n=1 Tax=Tissierella sp. MB52-C2 TaxID=3070999 RepID=UPI00280B1D51|nr:GrdX family protein [Tissierella sp. MB52-C2]WMM26003.1 GrdX family protein [Tissierella sp. MB52-C2]
MKNNIGYQIVTNNPTIRDEYKEVIFVEGSFEDVLFKVRDLVHTGFELINHPLGASIRMFFSPYRSIIVRENLEKANDVYAETIENSIANYKKHMNVRKPDVVNSGDYALIDAELLKSALDEYERVYN